MRYDPMEERDKEDGGKEYLCQLCGEWVPPVKLSRFEEGVCKKCYEGENEEHVTGSNVMVKVKEATYLGDNLLNPGTWISGMFDRLPPEYLTIKVSELREILSHMEAEGFGSSPVLVHGCAVETVQRFDDDYIIHINWPGEEIDCE